MAESARNPTGNDWKQEQNDDDDDDDDDEEG